ncbi:MAG: anthranilate synthase component I [Corynebacteriales bacterium]|nr:anthranilate synthase component I [Mycobacteriales bacterium]
MATGVITPDRTEFGVQAQSRRVIPVVRRLLADGETPIGLYQKLANGPGTFLLESAEPGRSWSRYSFIGVRTTATLTEQNGEVRWLGQPPEGVPTTGDPLTALRDTVSLLAGASLPGLPSLTSGLVGFLSYDIVRRLERLPDTGADELDVPELAMMLVSDVVVCDHHDGTLLLIANAVLPEDADEATKNSAYDQAIGRLDAMTTALTHPTAASVSTMTGAVAPTIRPRTSDEDYQKSVRAAKEAINAGECFQIVLSQRYEMASQAQPLDVYRVLRTTNPSPYMYLLRFDDYDIVGSSPEAHIKVTGNKAILHPIAGTRWRGKDQEEDAALAEELMADPKERAEHVMLVDLARNDLGRVCEPGTVEVLDFMTIEQYSHVMHIVSTVQGQLAPTHSAFDALTATFPAGTLSGAPKVRAMQLIDEAEPVRRGPYGGTVGYIGFAGDLDMAITIRTAVLQGGRAYVQAGAGIVADSVPESEARECRNKAAAVLNAIATAETLRPVR